MTDSFDSQKIFSRLGIFLDEQRRRRNWIRIKRILIAILVIWIFFQFYKAKNNDYKTQQKDHIGLIDINGTIDDNHTASSDNFGKSLNKAYASKSLKALILRINSPGGSPVQADYMYNAIQYYKTKYPNIKTYAVCTDICASAAYYIAAATDEIYANPSSLVGSIGVLYNGFGFVDAMQKLGVTRRLQTAGKNKGFLDPFSPIEPSQQEKLQSMLDEIHNIFISRVKSGRGDRLKIDNETFSGLFWTGVQARNKGLIDGFGSAGQLARDVIKVTSVVNYTHKDSVLEKMAKNIGASMITNASKALGIKEAITY